ncbi:uncharacterized protein LOC111708643 [Eurytemora carolleeae]|uniref:uncharacterized protein LOC111708643 n=1 Tax=Eurytemora carolleeae TaxID=1294199 RepID=UPI000C762AE7|nr:uncharacterized protein LOC111708643 [Eurytemora carolleeae]|eukprot:XP_023337850.1 uncharacterized protein LOC111708643 [Eurytemora affinis]
MRKDIILNMVKEGGTRVPSIETGHFQDQCEYGSYSPDNNCNSTSISTRESSPDYRLEIMSVCTSASLSPIPPLSPSPPDSPSRKTPVSADSPLLSKAPTDPARRRLKSFTKTLRRARSFRASREKSVDTVGCDILNLSGQEVTFIIKKSVSGRIGWKIMPVDENLNLRMNANVLEQVMNRIRDLQFSGQVVPDKMSLLIQ